MRNTFYCFDLLSGFLISTLYLTIDEAAPRSDLTTVAPPVETVEERAWFDTETSTWTLIPR